MQRRPGGTLSRRPLHLVWILDTSGSMRVDGKIQALNVAIRETIPHLASAAQDNPSSELLTRAVTFATSASWHIAEPTRIADVRWTDVSAGGRTAMGEALGVVAAQLKSPPMPERAVSPVLILVTDGYYTDDFDAGLRALLAEQWGREARRLAISIGRDVSRRALKAFIDDDAIEPLQANNPEGLVRHIRWASISGVQSASQVLDDAERRRQHSAQASGQFDGSDEW